MNTKARFVLIFALVLLGGAALAAVTWAAPGHAPLAQGGAPTVVSYQGEVQVGGTPYSGSGYFKFAVVNAAGSATYWSNDGTSTGGGAPTAAVQLTVSEGVFGLLLGDSALGGMTQALTADVFSQPERYLRVWFSDDGSAFDQLTPDTRIAAVPYALQAQEAVDADTVDGLHAGELGAHYQNVVIVAKSGGDYASVQAAIDSITGAAADTPYLVWVAPGVYAEQVTMKPYVHLQGAGQEATVITSTVSGSAWPPQATLKLASDASLRDLTVGNSGAGDLNAALLATAGTTRTLVADVTARAQGGGVSNHAIVLNGNGTGIMLQQVTALAEGGSSANLGLANYNGAVATLRGGSFTGRGGTDARGIYNLYSATLDAEGVTALGENSSSNRGLENRDGAAATLRGGSFTGRGGGKGEGLSNSGSSTTLEAESVTALGENSSSENRGLFNGDGAAATLRGGSFTGRGGTHTRGIYNLGVSATLEAESVTGLAEDGSNTNYGLLNYSGAAATLRGGSFTGRGGESAYGIHSYGSGTTLEAESVTALGEDCSGANRGLDNRDGAMATLRGGSFTGRGGTHPRGIVNLGNDTTLDAESATALAENGSGGNHGLYNVSGAAAMLRGGSFTARGGTHAYGIYNSYSGGLKAESVTAQGEDGSDYNYGLYNSGAAEAVLRNGSFTGRGGLTTYGIYNSGVGTTLEAQSVTALGENGSSSNRGLDIRDGQVAMLRGGSFIGRGGTAAYGIYNSGNSPSRLKAESVTALGEDAFLYNRGLYNDTFAVTNVTQSVLEGATPVRSAGIFVVAVSNSRLVGGEVSGSVSCVAVSRDTNFNANGCP